MIPIQITITSNNTSPLIELLKTAGPFIGAWIGAGIAGLLTIRAYRTNQWWETRRKAYQNVVEVIHKCTKTCTTYRRELIKEEVSEQIQLDANDIISKAANEYTEAGKALHDLTGLGRFSMSDKAQTVLVTLVRDVLSIERSNEINVIKLATIKKKLNSKLAEFIKVSKKDLQVYPLQIRLAEKYASARKSFLIKAKVGWRSVKLVLLIIWFGDVKGRRLLAP